MADGIFFSPFSYKPGLLELVLQDFLLVILILLITAFPRIYSAVALMTLARKTDVPKDWLAWIPIADVYLTAKISGVSPRFTVVVVSTSVLFTLSALLLLLGSSLAPKLSILEDLRLVESASIALAIFGLAFLVMNVILWWKIAEARQKHGWLALLMLIPVVNLVAMGFIAWKD